LSLCLAILPQYELVFMQIYIYHNVIIRRPLQSRCLQVPIPQIGSVGFIFVISSKHCGYELGAATFKNLDHCHWQ